jgi:hypothetical protein
VHTENYFTSLYNESQATDHTNVNINQHLPTLETTRDAKMVAAEAAAAVEAKASTAATAA